MIAKIRFAGLLALSTLTVQAAGVGDSLDKVLAEKGNPMSEIDAGDLQLMNYPDSTIKVKSGVVVEIKSREQARGPATHPVARPASASLPRHPAAEADHNWRTDYQAALDEAKEQNRYVFVFFTGSDWCGWCKRLSREVLSTPEFARYAGEKLVLLKLDFPRYNPQPDSLKAQNERLAQQYQIRGFPTVVLLNPAGRPVARFGYREGGPAPYIQNLDRAVYVANASVGPRATVGGD